VKAGSKVRNIVGVIEWIHLILDRKWWRTVVNRLYKYALNLFVNGGIISFSRQTLLCVLLVGFKLADNLVS
jgi:hypothetical protein